MLPIIHQVDAPPGLRLVPYLFSTAYGTEADGVWSAPYPLRLAGGRAEPGESGEAALIAATGWQVVVAAAPRSDGLLRLGSIEHAADPIVVRTAAPQDPAPAWAKPLRDVAWKLSELTPDGHRNGLDLLVHTDLPPSTGLSSAAPLACATALAWTAFHGPTRSADRLDAPARDVILSAATPDPDDDALCTSVLHARTGHAVVTDASGRLTRHVPFPLAEAGLRLALITPRSPGKPAEPPAPSTPPPTPPARMISLLAEGHIDSAATLLTDSHHPQAGGDPQADLAVTAALNAGAFGARCATPGSSAVVAIIPGNQLRAVRSAVTTTFRQHTLPTPYFLTTTTAPPARREA